MLSYHISFQSNAFSQACPALKTFPSFPMPPIICMPTGNLTPLSTSTFPTGIVMAGCPVASNCTVLLVNPTVGLIV